jgi:hypothetical protein
MSLKKHDTTHFFPTSLGFHMSKACATKGDPAGYPPSADAKYVEHSLGAEYAVVAGSHEVTVPSLVSAGLATIDILRKSED